MSRFQILQECLGLKYFSSVHISNILAVSRCQIFQKCPSFKYFLQYAGFKYLRIVEVPNIYTIFRFQIDQQYSCFEYFSNDQVSNIKAVRISNISAMFNYFGIIQGVLKMFSAKYRFHIFPQCQGFKYYQKYPGLSTFSYIQV